jgi:uncharacterized membrane protein YbhN (UPF0104 family)
VRLAGGALVLVMLVWRAGTGPFVEGIRQTSAWSLLVAATVTAGTTWCCAWRWQAVAGRLGAHLDLPDAFAAVYRAQFLNATLPGGVLGDVDRAVGHGRRTGSVAASVRSVVWERTLGQAVQIGLTVALLVVVPSGLRGLGAAVVVGLVAMCCLLLASQFLLPRARVLPLVADLRLILGSPARTGILVASALAVLGHLTVFLVAAHVAGVTASTSTLLPLGAVVLLAAAVPTNVAGWGPREGVAAWAFAAAGLGASAGLTTAVVYGVMTLAATLPGAAVLLAGRRVSLARTVVRARPRGGRPWLTGRTPC